MYKNIDSLCYTPENNIILLINYTSIKKKKKQQLGAYITCPYSGKRLEICSTEGKTEVLN